jgi:hypothetical protein
MQTLRLRRSAVKLVATIFIAIAMHAGVTAAQEPQRPSEAQIRGWIEQLANTSTPRRHSTPSDRLSKEERKSLEPVEEGFRELTRHFHESLPFLIEHLNDKRFSYPREHPTSGVFYNQNVGHACHAIIQGKVLLTDLSFIDDRDIGVWVELPLNKDWYEDVSRMTLYEMQVDAIDRLLEYPKLERVTNKQWEDGLIEVRQFRAEFVRKGKAVDRTFGPPIEGK